MTVSTEADARRLLSDDGTSTAVPNTFTSVGDHAFSNYNRAFPLLVTVILPNTITSIGHLAFYKCSSLKSIKLPNSITHIDSSAFAECTALESIVLPNSITTIPDHIFQGCSALSSMSTPPSVFRIVPYAFGECISLKSIIVPDAAPNNNNYGIWNINGTFHDPFEGCTELIAISHALNMTVKQYLLNR